MEKRIELERRGKEPCKVTELNLDNTRATQIEGLTDEYINLESLSLINVGLTTLKGFPKLPGLTKLELSDNRISSGLSALKDCPKLSHLNLSNNRIKDLESLEPLQSFTNLTHLDLFNNSICEIEEYRLKVFKLLPNLKVLDDADANGKEVEESEDGEDGEDGQNGTLEGEEDDDLDGDEEKDGSEEEENSDDEDDGPGLAALYNDSLGDEDDEEDFDENGEEEDEEDIEDEEEESEEPRGKRRRVEDSGEDGTGESVL